MGVSAETKKRKFNTRADTLSRSDVPKMYDSLKPNIILRKTTTRSSAARSPKTRNKATNDKPVRFNPIDEAVYEWYLKTVAGSKSPVASTALCDHANRFAKVFNVEGFVADENWLKLFMDRRGIELNKTTTTDQRPSEKNKSKGPDASGCHSPAGPSSEMESFMSTMQVGQMPLSGGSDGQDSNGELDDSINIKAEPVLGASPEVAEEYDNTSLNIDRNASPSPPPSMTGPYLLKKETHSSTILDQLMRDESFTDVILTAEGQSIKAHKVVLCLASSYFRQVLKKESNVQSVVVFRDIKFEELKNLVNFMYTGEATVDASNLESFMRTAEMLEVSSLCDGQCSIPRSFLSKSIPEPEPEQNNHNRPPPNKRQRQLQRSSSTDKSDRVSTPPQKNKRVRKHSPSNEVNSKNTSGASSTTNNISGIDSKVSIKSEPGEQDHGVACSPKDPSLSDPGDENSVLTSEKLVPGRCPFCPDPENDRQGPALTNHILITHPDKTAFVCDNCAKVFFVEGSYLAHMSDCFR